MKYYLVILISFIFGSCREAINDRTYEIPDLLENIKSFRFAKKCFEKDMSLVVVNLYAKDDTLSVELSDTYPDIREMQFNCDTTLYGKRILFTGEKIKGFSRKPSAGDFPSDIVELNKNIQSLLAEEGTIWLFRYKDGKLIYKDLPCAERQ